MVPRGPVEDSQFLQDTTPTNPYTYADIADKNSEISRDYDYL